VGHAPSLRLDFTGVMDRATSDLWLRVFEKHATGPLSARRFGPPNAAEAAATFAHCAPARAR
jgi:hypothetical protein